MEKPGGAIIEYISPFSNEYGGMTTVEDKIIFPEGCFTFLSEFEEQSSLYFQTNTCVAQSFNNGAEMVTEQAIETCEISEQNIKWLEDGGYFLNGKLNFNDRALAIISKTDPDKGISGEKVASAAKEYGLAAESIWPFNLREHDPKKNNKENYWNNFMLPANVVSQMAEFKKRFEIQTEWVHRNKWKEAEKRGALQGYVNAWYERNGKYYNPTGIFNHAIQPINYEMIEIFDTFTPAIKQMESEKDINEWLLKINIRERKSMPPKIENNLLIFMAEGVGAFGLFLDNRIIVDDLAKVMAMWIMRNNGKLENKTKTLTKADWELFSKSDLKGNKI